MQTEENYVKAYAEKPYKKTFVYNLCHACVIKIHQKDSTLFDALCTPENILKIVELLNDYRGTFFFLEENEFVVKKSIDTLNKLDKLIGENDDNQL